MHLNDKPKLKENINDMKASIGISDKSKNSSQSYQFVQNSRQMGMDKSIKSNSNMQTVMANYNTNQVVGLNQRMGVNQSQDNVPGVYIVNGGDQLQISSINFNKQQKSVQLQN